MSVPHYIFDFIPEPLGPSDLLQIRAGEWFGVRHDFPIFIAGEDGGNVPTCVDAAFLLHLESIRGRPTWTPLVLYGGLRVCSPWPFGLAPWFRGPRSTSPDPQLRAGQSGGESGSPDQVFPQKREEYSRTPDPDIDPNQIALDATKDCRSFKRRRRAARAGDA